MLVLESLGLSLNDQHWNPVGLCMTDLLIMNYQYWNPIGLSVNDQY